MRSFWDPRMYEINAKYIVSKINVIMKKGQLSKDVQYTGLVKPLFSNYGQEKLLLFYSDDLNMISRTNEQKIKIMNDNLNIMSATLGDRKIQLIFLPAVDKYDLYSKFIENNMLPINPLFSYMRKLKKEYIFIDTKYILEQELEKGEKDIYWFDDTHWSWKGQREVAKSLVNALNIIDRGNKTRK